MEKILELCPLFFGLNFDEISQELDNIKYKLKTYKKDEIIALSNSVCNEMLIIMQGSVKAEMTDFTGKIIKIEDIENPRPLAPAFLFGERNKYPVTIVANNKVEILSIHRDSFIKLMQENEIILRNFLNIISNRAQFLSEKIRLLSFHTIKGKISNYLLQLSRKSGMDEVILPHSQNQLAELFGVARPSIGRTIRELDRDGFIKARGKQIRIIDKKGLSLLLR